MTEQLVHHRQRRRAHHEDATDGFERLDETACWALLAEAPVGRIGVAVHGAAEIYPVNYTVDRQADGTPAIVFRTDPGTKIAGLAGTPLVSFEVDEVDLDEQTGWSVVVKGRARQMRELADTDERHRVEGQPDESWDVAPKRRWIRLEPTEVTGHRIGPPTAPDVRSHQHLGDLPTVAEWTGRDVWVPPSPKGTSAMKTLHGNDQVGLVMRAPVVAVRPSATLRAAAAVLGQHDIGAVAVVEQGALVGVLSERDVVRAIADGADPGCTPVARAMTVEPHVVEPDTPLWAATMLMLRAGVRHLPVAERGRAVGMLSIRDALAVMERDRIIEPGSHIETVHDPLGPT